MCDYVFFSSVVFHKNLSFICPIFWLCRMIFAVRAIENILQEDAVYLKSQVAREEQ